MSRGSRSGRLGGDLGEMGLPELVQFLTGGMKTACVMLRCGARQGELWFRGGILVHAATATRFGDLAVFEMLGWTEGEFVVEYGVVSDARSITQDATFLVLEGLRQRDEQSERETSPAPAPPVVDVVPRASRHGGTIAAAVVAMLGVATLTAVTLLGGPAAPEAVATMEPPPPAPVVAKKSPVKSAPKKKSPVKPTAPAVPPAAPVAPDSPLADQPVPFSPVAPEPALMLDSMEPATAPIVSTLIVSGKSSGAGGAIVLFVDGKPVLRHDELDAGTSFGTKIEVTPGEHIVAARLESDGENTVDSVRASFASGESRTVRIAANRRFGSPVKLTLERVD